MILFEHGYSLDKVHFFKNIRWTLCTAIAAPVLTTAFSTITIFAVFGTVIAAAFCAFGIYFLGQVCDHPCNHLLPSHLNTPNPTRSSVGPGASSLAALLRYFRLRHVCGMLPTATLHAIVLIPPTPSGRSSRNARHIQGDEG